MLLAQEASIGSVEDGSYIGSDISQVDWQTEQTMDSSLSRVVQLQTSGHKSIQHYISFAVQNFYLISMLHFTAPYLSRRLNVVCFDIFVCVPRTCSSLAGVSR